MRFLASLAAAALMAVSAANAATITDDAAFLGLWGGDIYAESTAPVSAEYAVDAVYITGGLGFSPLYAIELMNGGSRVLLSETSNWTLTGGNILSFLFALEEGSSFGDWLKVTLTFADLIVSPLDLANDLSVTAQMTITTGDDTVPAPVPVPAALPLLLSALAAAAALARRKTA